WVNVALQLYSDDPTLRFLITAGEAEERVIGEFVALLDAAGVPYDLASQLPLPVLGSLLQRCRLYLGHDSGISHLAAACGVPSVLLFGKTDPAIWAPQNPKVSVIRAPEGDLSQIDPKVVTVAASQRLAEGRDPETFSPA
ncbi:MAG: hypothetical protein KDM63_14425, partial [Verrucomicrobiae bacterium]|nr:hypothetical protein [Verrucomicrobiae bacterium]